MAQLFSLLGHPHQLGLDHHGPPHPSRPLAGQAARAAAAQRGAGGAATRGAWDWAIRHQLSRPVRAPAGAWVRPMGRGLDHGSWGSWMVKLVKLYR